MNSMNHQGYTARIEYDARDNLFVGRILGIRAIISFHGQTAKEPCKAFAHAVEDYLAKCSEKGVGPEKPASGRLLLSITPEVHGRGSSLRQEPQPVAS